MATSAPESRCMHRVAPILRSDARMPAGGTGFRVGLSDLRVIEQVFL